MARLAAVLFALPLVSCGASWTDTFTGEDSRVVPDAGIVDENDVADECSGLAATKTPVNPITVTFPNHGTSMETIHLVAASSSCDMNVDTDTDSVIFVSDATPCAPILAPGTPSMASVTVYGTGSPNDMQFQWTYSGGFCTIIDDYALSKK